MPGDTGFFQINDVVLNIPPTQIQVDRQSANNRWQTLRTRSSIKSKSGYSVVNIVVKASFVTSHGFDGSKGQNGLQQLRDIIAGLRVTPFCYVQNQFLRNTMLGGSSTPSMVLAVRQIQIIKGNDTPNRVDAIFYFSWFNYFPYLREWLYKKDFFSIIPTVDPRQSKPWSVMLDAEQRKGKFNGVYSDIYDLEDLSWMHYMQYTTMKVDQASHLEEKISELKSLRKAAPSFAQNARSDGEGNIKDAIAKKIAENKTLGKKGAETVLSEMFGGTTSQLPTEPKRAAKTLQSLINQQISVYEDRLEWKVVLNNKGKAIIYNASPEGTASDQEYTGSEILLFQKERMFVFGQHNINITAITISFENVLAVIPMMGQPYPTYQHVGSIDAVVSISMTTTSEEGVKAISNFYSMVEDQAVKFKNLPQGHRNIRFENSLVKMCGLYHFLPESITTETVPGQPGTYNINVTLVDNPLNRSTREELAPSQSFSTTMDIRTEISNILLNNIAYTGGGEYKYSPKKKNDQLDAAFADLCRIYAENISELYKEILDAMRDKSKRPISEFYALRNNDAPGIERLQKDMFAQIRTSTNTIPGIGFANTPDRARRLAINNIEQSQNNAMAQIKRWEQEKRSGQYEGTGVDLISKVQQNLEDSGVGRLDAFKRDHLQDWLAFCIRFLDTILYSGKINLPQFAPVKRKIDQMMMTNSSGHSYPDFPLDDVVAILANDDDPVYAQVIAELKDAASKGDFGLRNIGISALLQPDFYLYNAQNDDLGTVIPSRMMKAARDGLLQGQADGRVASEDNWLSEEYERKVTGDQLALQIRRDAVDTNFDEDFWGSKTEANQIARSIHDRTGGAFHFNDLQDVNGGRGMSCSLITEAGIEPIMLPDIVDSGTQTKGEEKAKRTPGDLILKNRQGAVMLPDAHHHSRVAHFFEKNSIDFKPKDSYLPPRVYPGRKMDPNKDPEWYWPTPEGVRRVTSRINPNRVHPTLKDKNGNPVIRPHKGTDFASDIPGQLIEGIPFYAPADGNITQMGFNDGGWGWYTKMEHSGGWRTVYAHSLYEGEYADLYSAFQKNGGRRMFVKAGTPIGRIGKTGGISSGAHLHWEVYNNKFSPNYVDGEALLQQGVGAKDQGPLVGFDATNESLFTKSVEQMEKDLSNGQGYSLMRAYPTFRLYFIESDIGERRRHGFDDFFSYSSVQEIQVIRSRKIAADLAVISITNISGNLTNKKFKEGPEPDKARDQDNQKVGEKAHYSTTTDTKDENPISSMMLKPGVQIQLRLGYSSNPDDLTTVMNGVITDVAQDESDDLITITCQSFGIELVQNQHGDSKSFGGWFSETGRTGKLLEELMAYPEVAHFGRWEGGKGTNTAYGILKTEYNFVPSPKDANIFAPGGRGIWGLFDFTDKYKLYQGTIWDVFQEMTLRHPAYVAYPVPYEGKFGPRMTMFFGVPDQLYYARDPTFKEDTATTALTQFVENAVNSLRVDAVADVMDPNKSFADRAKALTVALELEDTPEMKVKLFWLKKQIKKFSLDQGFIRPFRSYHVLTSTQHIMANSIASSSNIYNTVTLQYGSSILGKIGEAITSLGTDLVMGNLGTFTLRCDAAVADEEVKELFAQYNNCKGYEMAKRYAVGLLLYCLKENYTGSLVIIGNPNIKPHDICYIFDEYSDMYGPIEVEQVVHRFSQKNGFITEITPDMVVHVNQESTLSTCDAMGLMGEAALRRIGLRSLPSVQTATAPQQSSGEGAVGSILNIATTGLGLAFDLAWSPVANMFYNSTENTAGTGRAETPWGLIGAFIFRKLITRTQLAHPFRYSPLVKHGRPMVGGLPIKKNKGSFISTVNKWAREADEGIGLLWDDLYDSISPSNWWTAEQGSLIDTVLGEHK